MRRTLAILLGLALALAVVGGAELRQRERERGAYTRVPDLKYVMEQRKVGIGWVEGRTPPARVPGKARVLAVGDSVTAGVGVRAPETWPGRLGALLGAEVHNFGETGWDAGQVASLLETRIGAWDPDVVVWGSYANDIFPTRVLTASASGDAVYVDTEVPDGARLLPARVGRMLLANSALFRHVQGVAYVRWVARDDEAPAGWYAAQVTRVAAWSARTGVPVVVLAIPAHVTAGPCTTPFCDTARSWYATLRAGLAESTLPWVDGMAAWEGRGPFPLPGVDDPDHPGAEGHRLLAEAVAPAVRARLPAP